MEPWAVTVINTCVAVSLQMNIVKPVSYGRYFADDMFKYVFLKEHVQISLKCVSNGLLDNKGALVQVIPGACYVPNYHLIPFLEAYITGA